MIKKVLAIAGSDPSGGAGIQADIRTIQALGCYPLSAITAVTVQNTLGVKDVVYLDDDLVFQQIKTILEDIKPDCIKLGMLGNELIVKKVAELLNSCCKHIPVVLDPVMVSTSGKRLLSLDGAIELVKYLLPIAYIVTPNINEAQHISGINISTLRDMRNACEIISKSGSKRVLLKGGHLENLPVDILLNEDGEYFEFYSDKKYYGELHGTGCTLSSALASYLARGYDTLRSISFAKAYILKAFKTSVKIGRGVGLIDHKGAALEVEKENV